MSLQPILTEAHPTNLDIPLQWNIAPQTLEMTQYLSDIDQETPKPERYHIISRFVFARKFGCFFGETEAYI
jgi:hypothetical protein